MKLDDFVTRIKNDLTKPSNEDTIVASVEFLNETHLLVTVPDGTAFSVRVKLVMGSEPE